MTEEIINEEGKEEELKGTSGSEAETVIPPKGSDADEKQLDKMTVIELREIAKVIPGVVGVTAMKKEELLVIIKEFRGIKDEEPVKKKVKKIGEKIITVKDLKKKVLNLKEEKDNARSGKDRKKINILRRRINRIKKHTRKLAQS